LAAPFRSRDEHRLHRLQDPWLRSGFTTLPSTDTEQGGAAFCPMIGCFPHVRTRHVDTYDGVRHPVRVWRRRSAAVTGIAFTDFGPRGCALASRLFLSLTPSREGRFLRGDRLVPGVHTRHADGYDVVCQLRRTWQRFSAAAMSIVFTDFGPRGCALASRLFLPPTPSRGEPHSGR
jgi:hypothetical protein